MEEIQIRQTKSKYKDAVNIIKVKGRLDAQSSEKLENFLSNSIKNRIYNIILDLKEVSYIGSTGIKVILFFINKLKNMKGNLKIINMPDTGLKIIKVMGIETKLEIYDSEEEAILSF